jgi:hypothetical protein
MKGLGTTFCRSMPSFITHIGDTRVIRGVCGLTLQVPSFAPFVGNFG